MAEKVVIGNAELWHGDCREVLPLLPPCDLILTDPPYGLGVKLHGGTWGTKFDDDYSAWDNEPAPDWLMGLMREKAGAMFVWGGNYYTLPPSRGWLVWHKPDAVATQASIELCWTSLDVNAKHYTHSRNAPTDKAHPTQKPLLLMSWCLSFAPDCATVIDPFMGSGTTGVACAQLGKAFTGIERERKYFDIACERIARAQAQGRMFADEPAPAPEQQGLGL